MSKPHSKTRKTITKAKLSLNSLMKSAEQPAAIIVGMVGGKFAYDMLDKAMSAINPGTAGLAGTVKSIVKPVILAGAGLVGMTYAKKPFIKNIALGVTCYGGASALSEVVDIAGLSIPGISSMANVPRALPPTGGAGPTTAGFRGPYTRQIKPVPGAIRSRIPDLL